MSTAAIEQEIARLEAQVEEGVYIPADARVLHQLKMIRDGANVRADEAEQRNAFREIVSRVWNGGDGSVFIHGSIANFKTVVSWLHPGESISPEWFKKAINDNPALLSQLSTVPTGALVSVDDDDAINSWLKSKGYGQSEANRNLIRSACNGSQFYTSQLEHALESGQLLLAKATEAEKKAIEDERAAQATEREQRRLLNASPAELRQVIRSESEQRAIDARDEQDRQHMEYVTARDAQKGYEPLPEIWQGHSLDAHFIKSAPASVLRILLRRYGSAQIDARLRESK